MAAEALLPIRATIVNCGSQQERAAKCQKDERCCHLEESSAKEVRQTLKDAETGPRNTVEARNGE